MECSIHIPLLSNLLWLFCKQKQKKRERGTHIKNTSPQFFPNTVSYIRSSVVIQSDLQGASDSSDEDDTEDFLSADTYKMVFVVNSELNMGTGKVAAQVAHAALSLFRNMIDTDAKAQMLMVWTHMG